MEYVSEFVYLGNKISKSGGSDEDVTARSKKAWQAFAILRPVWKSTAISTRTKLRLFSSNVKSVLLYGSETWGAPCSNYKKIQTFINKCLRQIPYLKWFDRVPNTDLRERANQEPIHVQIRRKKWRWIGHTLRKEPSNVTRQSLDWNPQEKRKRGRPKQTWKRSILDELRTTGLTFDAAKKYANDRKKWKITVEALCSRRGRKD
uniref:DUF6451 domain-containing protein n=1 Tax=Octopus bimaculoides TaxID=37653 RepID=A0A0L8G8H3_OCTBM